MERLLPLFQNTSLILGSVRVARSRVETVREIKIRINTALEWISPDRLILAPDCGLGFLDENQILGKLCTMVAVAQSM